MPGRSADPQPYRRSNDSRIDNLLTQIAELRQATAAVRNDLIAHAVQGQAKTQRLADKLKEIDDELKDLTTSAENSKNDRSRLAADLRRVDEQLRGEDGLVIQVDRLIQSNSQIVSLLRVIFGSVAGAIILAILNLILK